MFALSAQLSRYLTIVALMVVTPLADATLIAVSGARYFPPAVEELPACEFYISTTGSDSNDGLTPGTAWALTALSSKPETGGAVTCIENGTYVLTTEPTSFLRGSQEITRSGTAEDRTIVRATNARQAIITGYNGSSYVTGACPGNGCGGGLIGIRASYVTVMNLDIRQGVQKGIVVSADGGARIHDIRIEGNRIDDFAGERRTAGWSGNDNVEGIRIEEADDVTVYNNWIEDIAGSATGSGMTTWGQINSSAVKIYDSDSTLIEQNTFLRSFACFYNKGAGGSGTNTIYRRNYCAQMGTAWRQNGLNDDSVAYITEISGSVFERVHNGVQESPGEDDGLNEPLLIKNNVFVVISTGWISQGVMLQSPTPGYFSFFNNLIWRPSGGAGSYGDFGMRGGTAANLVGGVIDYNGYPTTPTFRINSTTYNLATWKSISGMDAASNSIASDPFVDSTGASGAAGFKLVGGSSYLNFGRSNGLSGGSAVNAGAFPSSGQTDQVGANWQ